MAGDMLQCRGCTEGQLRNFSVKQLQDQYLNLTQLTLIVPSAFLPGKTKALILHCKSQDAGELAVAPLLISANGMQCRWNVVPVGSENRVEEKFLAGTYTGLAE